MAVPTKISATYEIDFADVKSAFLDIVAEGKTAPASYGRGGHGILRHLYEMAATPYAVNSWLGGSGSQACGYVRTGFKSDNFKTAGKYVKAAVKKRKRYSDSDGMPNLDRLYSGEPNFYEIKTPREVKPGMTINVEMFFAGMVDAPVIQTYGGWVAAFVGSLEAKGYDLEVNLVTDVTALFEGDSRSKRSNLLTRVKSRGQKSRFHSWSCLFAPTGFRTLTFLGFHVAGAKYGKVPTNHLAMSLDTSRYGVTYDEKTNTVTIHAHQRANSCDLEALTREAQAAGVL